ncbi:hypothetical protein [Mycobacterium sp. TY815]|uniref:hypothetical protein n=1 Tax=Mycobacterium sp. TY815 TaxID=3050581 RepID=UPI0027416187|nr:hypothetical protein [Mycobacterium sp. TY815]MDP7707395.1 hypothetical protein [Mycobacterium sp. TY815]
MVKSIHVDISALARASADWLSDAPTQGNPPPAGSPLPDDPIAVATMAILSEWSATHEAMVATRAARAEHLSIANYTTMGILSTTDETNAALISKDSA